MQLYNTSGRNSFLPFNIYDSTSVTGSLHCEVLMNKCARIDGVSLNFSLFDLKDVSHF